MTYDLSTFLQTPGQPGWAGALMDEYARAAEDFCRAVESLPVATSQKIKKSEDPDCTSIQNICVHVLLAARGYANHLLRAQDLSLPYQKEVSVEQINGPKAVRPMLAEFTRYTERVLAEVLKLPQDKQEAITVRVTWGLPMQIDLLLEHAIVHLLRHRRQIERW